ncbi:MAG TPA: hypothetical protein VIJ79_00310 [Acidobacteriaceae bacterium]
MPFMPLLPPRPQFIPVTYAESRSIPDPRKPTDEPHLEESHFEEPPDLRPLDEIQATWAPFAVTGTLIPGGIPASAAMLSDPELIAAANDVLERWFINYRRGADSSRGRGQMSIKEYRASTVEEFWELPSPQRYLLNPHNRPIFRGQADARWKLTPSILRGKKQRRQQAASLRGPTRSPPGSLQQSRK